MAGHANPKPKRAPTRTTWAKGNPGQGPPSGIPANGSISPGGGDRPARPFSALYQPARRGLTAAERAERDAERAELMKAELFRLAQESPYDAVRVRAIETGLNRIEGTPVSRTQMLGEDGQPVDPGRPVFVVQIEG
jgi:hypothetical protein